MQRVVTMLLLGVTAVAAEDLDGKITSGKAKKIFRRAVPLLKEAYAVRRSILLIDDPESEELEAGLRKSVRLYDKATILLNEALEIKYDPGVNAILMRAAREMAKSRAGLTWIEMRRRAKQIEEERKRNPKPRPKPEPEPEPIPEPIRRVPHFEAKRPPARPVDIRPRRRDEPPLLSDAEWLKRNRKGIHARLKDYYGARKSNKLRARCKLCAGKGTYRDGSACGECHGSGVQINLHYFRKAYWNGFTPLLRDSEGALDALRAFLDHVRKNPEDLGAVVKTFKVTSIEPHGA